MEEKKYPIKYNKDYYVISANDLIKGNQKMTLREAKILMVAMSQILKEDKDFKTYTTTIPELARFLDIDTRSLYRDMEIICGELMKRFVTVKFGKNRREWKMFHWVDSAQYDGDCNLTLRLSDEIKPLMLDLVSHYTQYQLSTVLDFSSYYTTRLYQLLQCEYGEKYGTKEDWHFSTEYLREFFQTENKYSKPADLIKKTFVVAMNELNKTSIVYIYNYRENKAKSRGNPISGVSFKVLFFDSFEQKQRMMVKYTNDNNFIT